MDAELDRLAKIQSDDKYDPHPIIFELRKIIINIIATMLVEHNGDTKRI